MTVHTTDAEAAAAESRDAHAAAPAGERAAAWSTPGYQIVETSMEVTAYFGAEL
ncbi:pyrroloquinoline quinone precursor peptide PqqA [Actinomadura mexicana]|uniref:Coenzyme PQQ synthesis protein A n=1 Tax=Actinomadura mexicana TaxID=134959 RepID=A0A238X5S7_9ACTN|nr:pyrroloquinoline quinone precursor peptide PqqA [Actinomadura mexicana]SNR54386.1 coenzyme PQQ precursor peptide PqqA [Actinomadura mexicana]